MEKMPAACTNSSCPRSRSAARMPTICGFPPEAYRAITPSSSRNCSAADGRSAIRAAPTVSKSTAAFLTSYGVPLSEKLFTYEKNSTVYAQANFGSGSTLNDEAVNLIKDYSGMFTAGGLRVSGVDYMIDRYINTKEGKGKGAKMPTITLNKTFQ